MIVRMAKVEIAGPKPILKDVLAMLQDLGIFQIEPAKLGFIDAGYEEQVRSFLPDEATLAERLFLEGIREKIEAVVATLPPMEVRTSFLEPLPVIDTVARSLDRHVRECRERAGRLDSLRKELRELGRYALFLDSLSPLVEKIPETPDLDFIGLSLEDRDIAGRVQELVARLTDGKYGFLTRDATDGNLVVLITVEKALSDRVKQALSDERIPEFAFPPSFSGLPFPEKILHVRQRTARLSSEIGTISREQEAFGRRWLPFYRRVSQWAGERINLLRAAASVFETRLCFFIHGWLPAGEIVRLREQLHRAFGGTVVLEEKELFEEDIDRVPIVLINPPFFRPFELLVRLLPLPKYTSFDPTPFIAVFFPVFFGMILGDAGYGMVLIVLARVLKRRYRKKQVISDALRILSFCAAYAVFFGILYGEFFGDLGHRIFGLEPVCFERRSAVIPALVFALATGAGHLILGLSLGVVTALRKGSRREALFRLVSILAVLMVIILVLSAFGLFPGALGRPVVLILLALTPLLFFTGGILAPLEFLKSLGNIVSYARIMAIGLSSVLLAFVANQIAGLTGDIVTGVIAAALLHLLNIILGVFSPAIHSLRLHYVEFFSKFLEHGGRRFEPLRK